MTNLVTKVKHETELVDTFVRDNLPNKEDWPDLINLEEFDYPEYLNVVDIIIDRHIREGNGDHRAIMAPNGIELSYKEVASQINRYANVLVSQLGMQPGHRVCLRSANNPAMVMLYLAIIKASGIVVATMPLLRGHEIAKIIDKSQATLCLCDIKLADEMEKTRQFSDFLQRIVYWDGLEGEELGALTSKASDEFTAFPTKADDPCLLGFTSGTTGVPKATIHFQRDLLIICDAYAKQVLKAKSSDIFIGSPPLAFTFGLGGLVLFPFHVGAATLLLEPGSPNEIAQAISTYHATIIFTAPTAYRMILENIQDYDLSSLRRCVSAGETLPFATYKAWYEATGLKLIDGIGATEFLHIFISTPEEDIRPGSTGKPLKGYEAKIFNDNGEECPRGISGRLAVRGPIGCRYLADERQKIYVQNGWNITGDIYTCDEDGYFWFQGRNDDIILSAGYNISGPEIESCLLLHEAVKEVCVVGAPSQERGNVVKAYIKVNDGFIGDTHLIEELQQFVRNSIAPFKYPRLIEFIDELPKTLSGKVQRNVLRDHAKEQSEKSQQQ